MSNHYVSSWKLYKSQHQDINFDFDYYLDLCKGSRTLELFAGFGRLTNYLIMQKVDIETVELEPNFAKYIQLPQEKNHICNVLDFNPIGKFNRIIAAYNSFCLFTKTDETFLFFKKIDSWLEKDGIVSLSYFHPDYWERYAGEKDHFDHEGDIIEHHSECDLTKRNNELGIWIDIYIHADKELRYEYPTRIYESTESLASFLKGTSLKIIDVLYDYDKPNPQYPGWIEFVLKKTI
ncbi:MAG: hypothetical protein ABI597_01825 [Gammaproteobacteria bacterium]